MGTCIFWCNPVWNSVICAMTSSVSSLVTWRSHITAENSNMNSMVTHMMADLPKRFSWSRMNTALYTMNPTMLHAIRIMKDSVAMVFIFQSVGVSGKKKKKADITTPRIPVKFSTVFRLPVSPRAIFTIPAETYR